MMHNQQKRYSQLIAALAAISVVALAWTAPCAWAEETASDDEIAASFEILYPEDRPQWVRRADTSPILRTEDGPVEVTVSSGPHTSWGEAQRALDEEIARATGQYVDKYLGVDSVSSFLHYDPEQKAQYKEEPIYSIGPMKQVHALLVFDDQFNQQLQQDWREFVAFSRLVKVALAAALGLGLLATLFGYLKADTATRGHYTGRLRLGAAGAILAIAAAGVFIARALPWL